MPTSTTTHSGIHIQEPPTTMRDPSAKTPPLTPAVQQSVSSMARAPQGASRFFTTTFGALSATTAGTSTMGMSSVRASVWALPLPCPILVAHLGAALDKSGWTMWHAQDRRQSWKTALTAAGEPTTAGMAKTLPLFAPADPGWRGGGEGCGRQGEGAWRRLLVAAVWQP